LSASLPDEILAFLRKHGLAAPGESPGAVALAGGVSSDIWRVDLASGPVAVKRALPRLRVAQLWEAPVTRNLYERKWLEAANAIVPGVAPKILAADEAGFFAMEYLGDLPLWKAELRAGRADPAFAAEVGRRLARIHAATSGREDIAAAFATDQNFHAIRLEPYLVATARVHPSLASVLNALVERTGNTKTALVHGDVSPKNILVGREGPIFLDAECAWYGDPAFDLAFCLNHMLLKCVWVPASSSAFLSCFLSLSQGYLENATWEKAEKLEERVATLLPGLLLARIDGKSPVEYITRDAEKERVRSVAKKLLLHPPATLTEVRSAWQES
jgi:aminoglycoside phosphotransferase (APT) family kinase protein